MIGVFPPSLLTNANNNELCHARKACFGTLVDPHALSLVGAEPMFTLQNSFKHLVQLGGGGGGEEGDGAMGSCFVMESWYTVTSEYY